MFHCVCVCRCVLVRVSECVYAWVFMSCMRACARVCALYVCLCTNVAVYMFTCILVCLCICIYVCVCIKVGISVYLHKHISISVKACVYKKLETLWKKEWEGRNEIPELREYTEYTFISNEYPLSHRILRAFQVTANYKYIQVLSVLPRKLMIRSCILTFFPSPGQYAKYLRGALLVLSISVSFTDNFFIILEGRFSQEFNFCWTSQRRSSS